MKKCGYIAIIGVPNAGKSTLLNQFIGSHIAITTRKAQTTRSNMLGITIYKNAQTIFIDTAGIYNAEEKFEKAMVNSAVSSIKNANIIALIVDSNRGICDNLRLIISHIKDNPTPKILILNKIDKISKEKLIPLVEEINSYCEFDKYFMISALKGQYIDDVMDYIAENLPVCEWLYDVDQMTDAPIRNITAEITREKIFLNLHAELPYNIAVETEKWEEKKDGSVRISQIIYVASEGHKRILIGKKGEILKKIGENSRKSISHLLDRKAHLFLFVKVSPDWKNKREFYENIGLDYQK